MSQAALLLAFGGAISFLAAALSGFWLDSWLKAHRGEPPDRYRMVLHKEALWNAFLCFALVGWIDDLPGSPALLLLLAASFVLTGWLAIGQYFFFVRAGVRDAYVDARPFMGRVFGAGALLANLAAVGGLLVAVVAAAL